MSASYNKKRLKCVFRKFEDKSTPEALTCPELKKKIGLLAGTKENGNIKTYSKHVYALQNTLESMQTNTETLYKCNFQISDRFRLTLRCAQSNISTVTGYVGYIIEVSLTSV